jgi:superfamily II DNA/RNA helicase
MHKPEELSLDCVKQYYICIGEDLKFETIVKVLTSAQYSQAVIYCNKVSTADLVLEELKKNKFSIAVLDPDSEDKNINNCLKEFKAGVFKILMLAGLVLRDIHVFTGLMINYDINERVNYIRRIGKVCRVGRGVAINFVTENELDFRSILKYYNINMEELSVDFTNIRTYE